MPRYFLIYIVIIILFQICNYFIWKTSSGQRQVAAYLRFGRLYFFLFLFLCILPNHSISSLFKSFCASCLILGYVMEFLLYYYFMKSCHTFYQNLRADSKIIIFGMCSGHMPCNPFRKFLDLLLIMFNALLGNLPLVIQRDDYLITQEVIAHAFRLEMEACPTYLYLHQSWLHRFGKRKAPFWKKEIALYLITPKEGCTLSKEDLPFPSEKIRLLGKDDLISFPQSLIAIIEDSGIHELAEKQLSLFKDYQGTEPGKRCLARLIHLILQNRHSVTEYFYELVKLAEFIIHYLALADYEISNSHYFDDDKPIAIGTFQNGITNTGTFEIQEKDAYIKALKYLHQVCTGKDGSINRKRLLAEGREKLVMVRNRFIGHGSMSYGISIDFVQNLLTIISAQADDFFHRTEPVLQQIHVLDVPKFYEQEDGLYLLIQIQHNETAFYFDYASGKYLTKLLSNR